MSKVTSFQIIQALKKRHTERQRPDMFFAEVKTGSTFLGRPRRLDAVAIAPSWTNPCIRGYEIKVDRGDFVQDDKWREYLPYTNEFLFACPPGIIQLDELPPDIGLMTYSPETQRLQLVRKPQYRNIAAERAWEMLYYIAIWRQDHWTNPFSSKRQEKIDAYLQGKVDKHDLACRFENNLIKRVTDAEEAAEDAKQMAEQFKAAAGYWEKVKALMKETGFDCGFYWDDGVFDKLAAYLKSGQSAGNLQAFRQIEAIVSRALNNAGAKR